MFLYSSQNKYWIQVLVRLIIDILLFNIFFIVALYLRFNSDWYDILKIYWFGILVGSIVFACGIYICDFYNIQRRKEYLKDALILLFLHIISSIVMMGVYYITIITVMGRGVMLLGVILSYIAVLIHHFCMNFWYKFNSEQFTMIIGSVEDEADLNNLLKIRFKSLKFSGVIIYEGYQIKNNFKILGSVKQILKICQRENIKRVLCSNRINLNHELHRDFCQLRYIGIIIMPIIGVYEELYHFCPVSLITPEWFMNASTAPNLNYIRKMKRTFDVVISIAGILILGPLLLMGMLAVRLLSGSPVFYYQTRMGRFDRPFTLIKLRTMGTNAESHGAEWSKDNDPRVSRVGRILRKYRIDELPQLFNVLQGDMSFIGPRPERPEFIQTLTQKIPFFNERLLVQPGLTGWAQVNYPYGNTIKDSRHKLEYDLYYIKHMNIFFDFFILLNTLEIIFRGGIKKSEKIKDINPSFALTQENI